MGGRCASEYVLGGGCVRPMRAENAGEGVVTFTSQGEESNPHAANRARWHLITNGKHKDGSKYQQLACWRGVCAHVCVRMCVSAGETVQLILFKIIASKCLQFIDLNDTAATGTAPPAGLAQELCHQCSHERAGNQSYIVPYQASWGLIVLIES